MMDAEVLLNHKAMFAIKEGSEVFVIGDMHLTSSTPKSRIDDYGTTALAKMASLRRMMVEHKSKFLIILGDVFHNAAIPVSYLTQVIAEFRKFEEDGIRVFSIVGNHDLRYDRLETLSQGPLGLLFATGVINPLTRLELYLDNSLFVFEGYHYTQELHKAENPEAYNICVAHRFYESSLDKVDSVTKEHVGELGYNMWLLGHDHVSYNTITVGERKAIICRPGSFMRASSHSYNLTRGVYTDVLRFNPKGVEVIRLDVPCKPAEEIFTAAAIEKPEKIQEIEVDFTGLIQSIYSEKSSDLDVYSVLDSIQTDERVKANVEAYLSEAGLFRKAV